MRLILGFLLSPLSIKFDHGSTSWLSRLFECCNITCGCRGRCGRNNLCTNVKVTGMTGPAKVGVGRGAVPVSPTCEVDALPLDHRGSRGWGEGGRGWQGWEIVQVTFQMIYKPSMNKVISVLLPPLPPPPLPSFFSLFMESFLYTAQPCYLLFIAHKIVI